MDILFTLPPPQASFPLGSANLLRKQSVFCMWSHSFTIQPITEENSTVSLGGKPSGILLLSPWGDLQCHHCANSSLLLSRVLCLAISFALSLGGTAFPLVLAHRQASMPRHLQAAGSPSPLRTLSLSTRFLLCYVQLHAHETTISASLVVSYVPFYISQLPTCQSFPPGFYAYCRLHHACFESDIRY